MNQKRDVFGLSVLNELEEKQSLLEKYIKTTDTGIEVNWSQLIKDSEKVDSTCKNRIADENYSKILEYLLMKDVLCYEGTKGSFFIQKDSHDASPYGVCGVYHFIRMKDAESFRKEKYKNAHHSTRICQNCLSFDTSEIEIVPYEHDKNTYQL